MREQVWETNFSRFYWDYNDLCIISTVNHLEIPWCRRISLTFRELAIQSWRLCIIIIKHCNEHWENFGIVRTPVHDSWIKLRKQNPRVKVCGFRLTYEQVIVVGPLLNNQRRSSCHTLAISYKKFCLGLFAYLLEDVVISLSTYLDKQVVA